MPAQHCIGVSKNAILTQRGWFNSFLWSYIEKPLVRQYGCIWTSCAWLRIFFSKNNLIETYGDGVGVQCVVFIYIDTKENFYRQWEMWTIKPDVGSVTCFMNEDVEGNTRKNSRECMATTRNKKITKREHLEQSRSSHSQDARLVRKNSA